jgi:opacity protein-like surface antigen
LLCKGASLFQKREVRRTLKGGSGAPILRRFSLKAVSSVRGRPYLKQAGDRCGRKSENRTRKGTGLKPRKRGLTKPTGGVLMKIVKVLLVSMFVMGICKPVHAFDVKSIKYIGSLDLFTVGTADNRYENILKSSKKDGKIGSYSVDSDMAFGYRLGALYPVQDIADVGLSFGYIGGPNGETKVNGIKNNEFSRRFYRVMAEGRKTFKYNDKFSFLGGAGLGLAYGRQEVRDALASYNSQGQLVHGSARTYFSGLTWELTAGVAYKATDKLNVEAGLKYTGLPSCDNQNDTVNGQGEIAGMNYNALGFFAGVSF